MQITHWSTGLSVEAGGHGVVSRTGAVLLRLLADRTGLTQAISAATTRRGFVPGQDRGRVMCWYVVDVREQAGIVVISAAVDGVHRVDDRGHLQLPLAVRRWCRLRPGDRLLLAADPASAVLVAYSLGLLDRLLADLHTTVAGGEAA